MFSLNKPYLGVGLGSRRLGVGLWPDRIRVESRDGEVGQASGRTLPGRPLLCLPIPFSTFHIYIFCLFI